MGRKIYEQTFKDRIIQLHLEEGRTISSLNKEYQLSSGTINNWLKAYQKICLSDPQKAEEKTLMQRFFVYAKSLMNLKRRTVS